MSAILLVTLLFVIVMIFEILRLYQMIGIILIRLYQMKTKVWIKQVSFSESISLEINVHYMLKKPKIMKKKENFKTVYLHEINHII